MMNEFESARKDGLRPTRYTTGALPIKPFPMEDLYFHHPRSVTLRERRSIPAGTDITSLNRLREIHRATHDGVKNVRNKIRVAENKLRQLLRVKNPRPDQLTRIQEYRAIVENKEALIQDAIQEVHDSNDALPLGDRAYHGNL